MSYRIERPAPGDLRPLSEVLEQLDSATTVANVGELIDHLKERGTAAVLACLALPIALPVPMPGISAIFGLPMLAIALQLAVHRRRLWVPQTLRRKGVDPTRFRQALPVALRWVRRIEMVLRPRWVLLCSPWLQSIYGLVCAWLALILFLPIPFGNVMPSLSVFLLAVGIMQRDGIAVLVGLALTLVSVAVTAAATGAAVYAIIAYLNQHLR